MKNPYIIYGDCHFSYTTHQINKQCNLHHKILYIVKYLQLKSAFLKINLFGFKNNILEMNKKDFKTAHYRLIVGREKQPVLYSV